jgi:hypothetical protein
VSYVYGTILHVDIRNGKIWIQRDFTEEGVALLVMSWDEIEAFKECVHRESKQEYPSKSLFFH